MKNHHNKHQLNWYILIGLGAIMIVLNIDFTIVNLALPDIGKEYNSSLSMLQWILNIYSIMFASTVIIVGKIGDKYSPKKVFLVGVLLFFIGSIISGAANGTPMILIGRVVQGLGMSAIFPMVYLIIEDSFDAKEKGLAIGTIILFSGVGQSIGPTLGGLITQQFGWRYIFLLNIPFCLISFILILIKCKIDKQKTNEKINYLNGIILSISIILIIGAINEAHNWGVSSWKFISILIIGIIIFSINLYAQKFLKNKIINLNLYSDPVYKSITLVRAFFQFSISAFVFLLPIYFQNGLGLTPAKAGLILLIMAITLAISSPFIGKIVARAGSPKNPMIIGQIFAFIGYLLIGFSLYNMTINWYFLAIGLICIGLNMSVLFNTTNKAATHYVPKDQKGMGFGMFVANGFFNTSFGIALMGLILSSISIHLFKTHDIALNIKGDISHYINGSQSVKLLGNMYPQDPEKIIKIGQTSFSAATSICMWILSGISLISIIFCFHRKSKYS